MRGPDLDDPARVPSRRAWMITLMLFASVTLNFIDRLVLANVAPSLQSEFHLSNTQYSYIVFAFMAGMTLGQLPVGMLIDRIGARLALPAILVAWSVINSLHAFARSATAFCSLRLVMGFFESGNYPSATKVIGSLFPARQRALALAFVDNGSLFGSVIAPPLVVLILTHFGWHIAFLLPGLLGVFWIVPWFRIYGPQVSTAGVARTDQPEGDANVRTLLKRRETWGVVFMRTFSGPVSQFYWYWLPLYLVNGRGMSLKGMATFSSLTFFLGGVGNIAGGVVSGWLIRRGVSVNASRKFVFTAGAALSATAVLIPLVPSLKMALLLLGLASFGLSSTSCILISTIVDVFPKPTLARVTGLTGMGEGVMNMIMTLATGIIVDRFSYTPIFAFAGLMPVLSILSLFLLVGPIRQITLSPVALANGEAAN